VDFGKTSTDYLRFRPGWPDSFYDRISQLLPSKTFRGLSVLDIGTGPGVVAFPLAERGAEVVGVDVSENQVLAARRGAAERGLVDKLRFEIATAENTNQKTASFDVVTAGQCWHWFHQTLAMKEIKRVLKPEGILVVCHYDYLPKRSRVAAETEKLILKYNSTWKFAGGDGLYPREVDQLVVEGGFDLVEQFCYDHKREFSHEAWVGRMRTCNGVGSGTLTDEQISTWEHDLKHLLVEQFPEPLHVWHRNWAVVVRNANLDA